MPEDRPVVRVGPVRFDIYGRRTQPDIDVSTGTRTVEKKPLDAPTTRQVVGTKATEARVVCECTLETANLVDTLDERGVVELRSDRISGEFIAESTDTRKLRTTEEFGPVYEASLRLVEVTNDELFEAEFEFADFVDGVVVSAASVSERVDDVVDDVNDTAE